MHYTHAATIRAVLGTMLGIACLAPAPAMADDCGGIPCRCMNCDVSPGPAPGGGGYSAPSYNQEAERAERNARYERIRRDAQAALDRKDYREALRLLRQQQALRDGPNVQDAIAQVNALMARQEAKEKAERDRKNPETEDAKVAAKMREQINKFAASLDTGPPGAGSVVIQGGATGDAMGTQRAQARLEFGDPYALEARGEQARQGFDKAGALMGSKPVTGGDLGVGRNPTFTSALAAQVPDSAKHDPIIAQALAWYQKLDKQKAETAHKLSAVREQLKQATGDTAVLAAQVGTLTNHIKQIETDQTKATNAAKGQVVNLGLQWNEIAAPPIAETKPTTAETNTQ